MAGIAKFERIFDALILAVVGTVAASISIGMIALCALIIKVVFVELFL